MEEFSRGSTCGFAGLATTLLDTPTCTVSYTDHLLSYRMESNDDLLAEKTALKNQRSVFVSQGMGSKTFQRDLRLLEERLQAVNFVLRERGYTIPDSRPTPNTMIFTTSFGNIQ